MRTKRMTAVLAGALAAVVMVGGVGTGLDLGNRVAQADNVRLPRAEVNVGTFLGSYAVGDAKGFTGGVHAGAGWRLGNLLVLGEGTLLRVGDSDDDKDPVQGTMTRLGLTGRYSLFTGGEREVSVDVWVEAGVGRELIAWDGGGELGRDDYAFGFGIQPRFRKNRYGSDDDKRQNQFGYLLALRMFVANDPGANKAQAPTCAGPCDRPTRAGRDIGFLFNWSFTFGK